MVIFIHKFFTVEFDFICIYEVRIKTGKLVIDCAYSITSSDSVEKVKKMYRSK